MGSVEADGGDLGTTLVHRAPAILFQMKKKKRHGNWVHGAFTGILQNICSDLPKSTAIAQGSYASALRVQRAVNLS